MPARETRLLLPCSPAGTYSCMPITVGVLVIAYFAVLLSAGEVFLVVLSHLILKLFNLK